MKTLGIIMTTLLAMFLLQGGCVLDEKVIQVVVSDKTCVEFTENENTDNFNTPRIVDYADELNRILDDAGYERADIDTAFVSADSISYELLQFAHTHDWDLTGRVTVQRTDVGGALTTLVNTMTTTITDSKIGNPQPVALTAAGIAVVNQALADYLNGDNPVLRFEVVGDDITPDPSDTDRMVFTWKFLVAIQVILGETLDIPDPF